MGLKPTFSLVHVAILTLFLILSYFSPKFKQEIGSSNFDLIFINGFEPSLAFSYLVRKIPTIIICDTLPKIAQELIRRETKNILLKVRSLISAFVISIWCKTVFPHVQFFLPISNWCADSLVYDYHISPDKITVLHSPLDLDKWGSKNHDQSGRLNLLFVGNDFARKGGPFLLEMFQGHLKESCMLKIISKDPSLKTMGNLDGVVVMSDIDHHCIHEVFGSADVFILPTWRDQLALVIGEAMAAGLPVVARNVGGIPNLVQDGVSGYLMTYESTQEQWVQKIEYLIDHPEERQRMGQNGRKIAEQMFDIKKFELKIKDVLWRAIEG